MSECYRYRLPDKLTPEVVLQAARQLVKAQAAGYDLSLALIEGLDIVVPSPIRDTAARIDGELEKREQIIQLIRRTGPATGAHIQKTLGLTNTERGRLIGYLVRNGRVTLIDRLYVLAEK